MSNADSSGYMTDRSVLPGGGSLAGVTNPGRGGERHTPLLALASYSNAVRAFAKLPAARPRFPRDIEEIVERFTDWNRRGQRALRRLESPPVCRQVFDFGCVVFDTHRLLRLVHTKRIDEWFHSPATDQQAKVAFEGWRRAFIERYDAVRALTADILLLSNLSMFEQNPLRIFVHNTRKLADVFAGGSYGWGTIGVALGTLAIVLRERHFIGRLIRSELAPAGIHLPSFRSSERLQRINAMASEVLITTRHARQLDVAYRMLKQHAVIGSQADAIVLAALRQADRAAGKPWKGLVKLRQLVEYSRVDPRRADFIDVFQTLTDAPVQYTHTPGLEWVVRDYELGRKLLQMDGRIPEGSEMARLQQGRVSVMPGISKAAPGATEFARRYFGPVANFLSSMVTADGADHQRLRKPFMKFFSRRAVFDQAQLVQATVTPLLDNAANAARKNHGAFDFKKDFAFQFPIRVICGIVGIHGADIERVQHWTEQSTRSMDTEAGVSSATAQLGHRSAAEQTAYFRQLLDNARASKPSSELVRSLAFAETLSEAERVANLSVIIFAGFETTTGLLCLGLRELLKHPDQWDYLLNSLVPGLEIEVDGQIVSDIDLRWFSWSETEPRDSDAGRRQRIGSLLKKSAALRQRLSAVQSLESKLDAAIEEMLRWNAPGSIIPLTASQDVEVPVPRAMVVRDQQFREGDNLKIAKGETVIVAVDEINRRCPLNAGRFDTQAAGSFDITRTDNSKHLSFGVKHMCIGATLARENSKRALEGVLRRFPDLQNNGPAIPQDMELFHGLASLPVRSPALCR